MNKKTLYIILSALLVCLTVCFIFSNSLLDGKESNQRSGLVMNLLRSIFDPDGTIEEETFHFFVRKGAHFSEFALLGLSLWLLMLSLRGRFGISCPGMMLFAALGTAVTDEFIQSFTGRTSSVSDVLIDFGGAVFAMAFLWIFHALRYKKERQHAAKECGTE